MNKVIERIKKKPLSDSEIMSLCNSPKDPCNLVTYGQLGDLEDIDQIFTPGCHKCILFIPIQSENDGHWSLLIRRSDSTLEYFCSYGLPPDEILRYSLVKTPHYLTNLLARSRYKNITYNKKKLQKNGAISTCGRHVALRCLMADLPIEKYRQLFVGNRDPDTYAAFLI